VLWGGVVDIWEEEVEFVLWWDVREMWVMGGYVIRRDLVLDSCGEEHVLFANCVGEVRGAGASFRDMA